MSGNLSSVLPADGERNVLQQQEGLPFAPSITTGLGAPRYTRTERLLVVAQRWRVPITLLFGALIAAAAFFAYESQMDDPIDAGQTTVTSEPDGDALSALVADVGAGDEDGGEESPTTVTTRQSSSTSLSEGTAGTIRATTTTGDRSATTRRTTTTEATTTTSDATSVPATIASTTSTTASTTSTTRQTTTTAAPTTTTTAPPVEPVFIGNKVTYDASNGDGVSGMNITLWRDADGDGQGDSVVATDVTAGNGTYGFDTDPGCYVVAFAIPAGLTVLEGSSPHPVCLTSGQRYNQADLILSEPFVAPPPSCEVQLGNNSYAGVQINDSNRNWAPSYAFYDSAGNFVLSTSSLGPPDDTTNPDRNQIEWTSQHYGYEESVIYSVAAEDGNGFRSSRVTCNRINV